MKKKARTIGPKRQAKHTRVATYNERLMMEKVVKSRMNARIVTI